MGPPDLIVEVMDMPYKHGSGLLRRLVLGLPLFQFTHIGQDIVGGEYGRERRGV